VLTENTQKEGASEDNTDSGPVASNGKERERASAQKQKKKEGKIPIFDTMLSSTRRRAALNTMEVLLLMSELRRRGRCQGCADARANAG
jgi:hypothetical protein